jgi:DNA-binding response OmpR family regulator
MWALDFAWTFADAEAALRTASFGVVICGGLFEDGHGWKDILNEIRRKPVPPQLIVADRLADEALWAEVLNLGCYDLLITPFEAEEVRRVVPMAWGLWQRALEPTATPSKAPGTAKPPGRHSRPSWASGAG